MDTRGAGTARAGLNLFVWRYELVLTVPSVTRAAQILAMTPITDREAVLIPNPRTPNPRQEAAPATRTARTAADWRVLATAVERRVNMVKISFLGLAEIQDWMSDVQHHYIGA